MNIITDRLPPELHNKWLGIDIEMFDMNEKQMHRPISGKFALMSIADGEDVYIINEENKVAPALELINNNWWIYHHAKFDLTHSRRWTNIPPRKRLWDTMLMERILFGGYYDDFALNDVVRRHLGFHMEKELQKSFSGNTVTPEQIQYAAMDAYVLPKIVEEQKKIATRDDFNVWMNIDRPALFAFMDFRGFAIDVPAWQELAVQNKIRQEQAEAELPFNPNSNGINGQAVKFYRANGFEKITDNKEETLEKFIDLYPDTVAAEMAKKVLICKTYGTRVSKYGMHFIEDYLEQDNGIDMIYADYWVIGAETGRTSCSDPNMQNIPVRDTKEYRKCFVARPKQKLIIVDYSAQEVFVAAYASQDKKLIDICNSDKDVYVASAKLILDIDIDKKDPKRNEMKPLILGSNYGMSKYGVAKKLGCSKEEAEEIIAKRIKAFPRLEEYLRTQSKSRNKVKTAAGRTIHLNHHSGQAERNALNGPVQGGAADCMKQALGNLHAGWLDYHNGLSGYPFPVVGYFHDELALDAPIEHVNDWKTAVQHTLISTANTMFPGMNFRADVSIGDTWADK